MSQAYSAVQLQDQLADMGISGGDTLLIHSSLKSVGQVEGRGEGLLGALEDYFRDGLLVLPTMTFRYVDRERPIFSVLDTPSCVGTLTELFRKRDGVVRSWHPTHSVAAHGPDAAEFVAGHELFDTPCARQSPWGKLWDRKAKILFVGVDLCNNTALHGVEEWVGVPGRLRMDRILLRVKTPSGRMVDVPSRLHADAASQYYGKLEGIFLKEGIMRCGRLGEASCSLLETDPMIRLVRRFLERDLYLFSHDKIPGPLD
jgi:aminoglycoside 3-N-acetyltransferase